jgi:hypothetical protein
MDDKSFLQGYKSILTSKDTEEAMVGIKLTKKQYLKIYTEDDA